MYNEKYNIFWIGPSENTKNVRKNLKKIFNIFLAEKCRSCGIPQNINPHLIIFEAEKSSGNCHYCRILEQRTVNSHIPVIALTSGRTNAHKVQFLSRGTQVVIQKSAPFPVIKMTISNLIFVQTELKNKFDFKKEPHKIPQNSFSVKVQRTILDNISNPDLSCEKLADLMHVSRTTLYKKLKKMTGNSPIDLIHKMRLVKARELLESNDLYISEVAYLVGFNSVNYFTALFKKHFGILPSNLKS